MLSCISLITCAIPISEKKWGGFDKRLKELAYPEGIARVATVTLQEGKEDDFLAFFEAEVPGAYAGAPGFKGAYLLIGEDGTAINTTLWRDQRCLDRNNARPTYTEIMGKMKDFIKDAPDTKTYALAAVLPPSTATEEEPPRGLKRESRESRAESASGGISYG